MRHLLVFALFLFPLLATATPPKERPNTVLIHPGEVLYAKFEQSGNSLKLLEVSKEKSDQAQLIFTMERFDKANGMQILKVMSRCKQNMTYKAEMRDLSKNRRKDTSVVPVFAGISAFESWPHPIDELALYGFELQQEETIQE